MIVTVQHEQQTYEIPALWLVGAMKSGLTWPQAIQQWHEQAEAGKQSRASEPNCRSA